MDIQLGLESGTVRVVPHDARWAQLYSEEATRIHALKQELARMHPRDRTAYMDGKTAFVLESLRRARELGVYGDDQPNPVPETLD